MTIRKQHFAMPDWTIKRTDNARGVEFRVLTQRKDLIVAELRFEPGATFDAHAAPWDCDVFCMSGRGFVLVGNETAELSADETVFWPRTTLHQLWTEDQPMQTLMIEHLHQVDDPARAWQALKNQNA